MYIGMAGWSSQVKWQDIREHKYKSAGSEASKH